MRSNRASVSLGRLFAGAALVAAIGASGDAHAQPNDESPKTSDDATKACVQAYESAQEDSKAELLLKARDELRVCAAPSCPRIMQTDCTNWLGQVVDAVPSVVFSARQGTEDVFDVTVSMDGKRLTTQLDGKPIEVDPGLHTFVFERSGSAPVEKKAIVGAREKAQFIAVTWTAAAPIVGTPLSESADQSTEKYRPVPPLFYVLGGTAVVGFGAFAILGLTSESTKHDLEISCSPHCARSEVSSLKTRLLVADIAAGVSAASAAGALVVFLARPSKDKRRPVGSTSFGVAGVDHGAQLQWSGHF